MQTPHTFPHLLMGGTHCRQTLPFLWAPPTASILSTWSLALKVLETSHTHLHTHTHTESPFFLGN